MLKSDFYYDLPQELIAQDPLQRRSDSRLLVLDRKTGEYKDDFFYNIGDYLQKGDVLVINNSKVIPARLIGNKVNTGGVCELLLLKRITDNRWESLAKPGKRLKKGTKVTFGDGLLNCTIIDTLEDGNKIVEFEFDGIFEEILDKLGTMPLPPYIKHELKDKDRYQTVYAKLPGSSAAPTAGLHFTKDLLEDIKSKGIQIVEVTLHVGLGTFRPVQEEEITNHEMHSETCEISKEAAKIINDAKKENRRVIAVGTTSARTLESFANSEGLVDSGLCDTDIFIYSGYDFKIIDGLITNFHLPESTLLMLISAFATREIIMDTYSHAIDERYRFFSFGDAMFIS